MKAGEFAVPKKGCRCNIAITLRPGYEFLIPPTIQNKEGNMERGPSRKSEAASCAIQDPLYCAEVAS
jgi:hypothetical protein